jgi:hypothetical protein
MLLKCGPLCPTAIAALTHTATEAPECKDEAEGQKKDGNQVSIEVITFLMFSFFWRLLPRITFSIP